MSRVDIKQDYRSHVELVKDWTPSVESNLCLYWGNSDWCHLFNLFIFVIATFTDKEEIVGIPDSLVTSDPSISI